jgi:translation elongation factor aEF-1 beta
MRILRTVGDLMGQVAMIFKLMPTDVDVDFEKMKSDIKTKLPPEAKLNLIKEVPIAFGLKSLEVQIILDDRKGGGDQIEKILGEIENVNSVDLIDMGLL